MSIDSGPLCLLNSFLDEPSQKGCADLPVQSTLLAHFELECMTTQSGQLAVLISMRRWRELRGPLGGCRLNVSTGEFDVKA
jgi:hypothetical protein